jgi:ribonuclease P protein component
MKREHRLRASADFQRARAFRRSWANHLMVLYVAPNDDRPLRLGISVSRRVGNAVVRNRVRRRVREAVRARLGDLLPGIDLVIIPRPESAAADWPTIKAAVEDLLRRARLLGPRSQLGQALS